MYHVPKDKRALMSAKLLYDGLIHLMTDRILEDIKVTDLCASANVGRATFYRLFDTPSDILLYEGTRCFMDAVDFSLPGDCSRQVPGRSVIERYLQFWYDHCELLELLHQQGRLDLIMSAQSMANQQLSSRTSHAQPTTYDTYLNMLKSGITLSILIAWLDGGKKETPQEIFQILTAIFSDITTMFHSSNPTGGPL